MGGWGRGVGVFSHVKLTFLRFKLIVAWNSALLGVFKLKLRLYPEGYCVNNYISYSVLGWNGGRATTYISICGCYSLRFTLPYNSCDLTISFRYLWNDWLYAYRPTNLCDINIMLFLLFSTAPRGTRRLAFLHQFSTQCWKIDGSCSESQESKGYGR